jgi:hypothetical protein
LSVWGPLHTVRRMGHQQQTYQSSCHSALGKQQQEPEDGRTEPLGGGGQSVKAGDLPQLLSLHR